MEWNILFLGSVGAGKTEAIKAVSDIEVVRTDVNPTDETALMKSQTTVAMDMGILELGAGDRVILYGAPGQNRFDFMLDILLQTAKGLVFLINNEASDPLGDLDHYLAQLSSFQSTFNRPLVIGITHMDVAPSPTIEQYKERLKQSKSAYASEILPIFAMDTRKSVDVKIALLTLTAMMRVKSQI